MLNRPVIFAVLVLASCQLEVPPHEERQQPVDCTDCDSFAHDVTVYNLGDVGAPTEQDIFDILQSPPAGTDLTMSSYDMEAVARGVVSIVPAELIDDVARPSGPLGCCTDWNLWTCWATIGGRTYFCRGTTEWSYCGSFSGGWR
jgi:hypothetical protein